MALDCDGDTRAGPGRPGRRRLPHRRPDLLRRRRAARSAVTTSRSAARRIDRPPDLDQTFRTLATRPPGHPGHPPAARRRRDPRRPLPQARRRAPRHLPAGVRRARPRPGRATPSSASQSHATLTERDGQAHWLGHPAGRRAHRRRPARRAARAPSRPCTPPATWTGRCRRSPAAWSATSATTSSAGWRRSARRTARDDLRLPELTMLLATDLAVLDHRDGTVPADRQRDQPQRPRRRRRRGATPTRVARLDAMAADLARPAPTRRAGAAAVRAARVHRPAGRRDYQAGRRATSRSASGRARRSRSCRSQRFETPTARPSALDVYRVLRATNPSPYMYLLRFDGLRRRRLQPGGAGQGRRTAGRCCTRSPAPAAAAPPRGGRGAGRGAAGRPQGAGRAPDARRPRPQRPRPGLRAGQRRGRRLHVGRALQPRHAHRLDRHRPARRAAGRRSTCSPPASRPAPCPARPSRARWRSSRSWSPPGAACTAAASATSTSPGDSDTAIAIRTALLRDGTAYVQAGAGIVADSDPAAEDTECRNKAAAVLRAVRDRGPAAAVRLEASVTIYPAGTLPYPAGGCGQAAAAPPQPPEASPPPRRPRRRTRCAVACSRPGAWVRGTAPGGGRRSLPSARRRHRAARRAGDRRPRRAGRGLRRAPPRPWRRLGAARPQWRGRRRQLGPRRDRQGGAGGEGVQVSG